MSSASSSSPSAPAPRSAPSGTRARRAGRASATSSRRRSPTQSASSSSCRAVARRSPGSRRSWRRRSTGSAPGWPGCAAPSRRPILGDVGNVADELPTRTLGRTGPEVSALGLGCNQIGRTVDRDGARRLIRECEEVGVSLVDTADTYGDAGTSESFLGEALAGRRDRFVVATKFGMQLSGIEGVPDVPRGSREYVRWAIEGSLARLQTDHIDLYQYHRPDGITPLEETLGALGELVGEGRVLHIGCSNFTAEQVDESARIAEERGWTGFVSLQNEYSLLERGLEADVVPACERQGLGVLPYFPLARG